MTKQIINVGTTANDKKGDSLRAAFQKVNANFTELYTALGLAADTTLNFGNFVFESNTVRLTNANNDDSTATQIEIAQPVRIESDLTVGGDIVPNTANGGNLGSLAKPFRSLFVSNNTIFLGNIPLSLDPGTNELQINNVPISQTINYADIPGIPTDIPDLSAVSESIIPDTDVAYDLGSPTNRFGTLYLSGIVSATNVNATTSFGLPVYATDAARDIAIPSPQPGMMIFVTSGEEAGLQVRGATQWNPVHGLTGV